MNKQEFLDEYLVDRHNTNSMKWDTLKDTYGDSNLISMWIADTEFKPAQRVTDAMIQRVLHGPMGYSIVPDSYYKAFSDWMEIRYNFPIKKDWIRFSTGVVTGIAYCVNAFTQVGESIMILSPVYYPFADVIKKNRRNLVEVDLNYDNKGHFSMNYDNIEKTIVDNDVKMFLQCSPHNPAGRVWTEDELAKVLEICKKHNVLVVSDEIHQDLVLSGHKFIPSATVANGKYRDNLVTLNSGSKSFNLAALNHSHIIITNQKLMEQYDQLAHAINRTEVDEMGVVATEAAYRYASSWLAHVLEIVEDNYNYLKKELRNRAPKITVCDLEGTYLVMIDLRKYVALDEVHDFVVKKCHLAVDYGEQFGEKYLGFVRLNMATDPRYVKAAVDNIVSAVAE
ncbi:pyridoxal phosphate-dependent aminotransferase [Lactobacillus sp. ESL0791]|uniref:MalY/PatB family protein n=1 Tax=Lactobacillus sp. ESL0791 TaxID=2983234 RepID=UPI0023F66CD9|nr:MalY/PatB family protein [Lactobacillus sp. ESL0791]MDF7639659.1 pyridoxal phosphate-dependent aminotransferase [Lactobacillus sp. ESL0791]